MFEKARQSHRLHGDWRVTHGKAMSNWTEAERELYFWAMLPEDDALKAGATKTKRAKATPKRMKTVIAHGKR
jgi:hypothetical protein